MSQARMNENGIKGMIILAMFIVLSLKSCMLRAQSFSREAIDRKIYQRVRAWEDSVKKAKPHQKPVYLGGELSLAFPQSDLKSKISQLNGLRMSYIGTNLAGVMGNAIGKLKAQAGLYYSEPSVPYTMTMLQGGLSASVYPLRLKNRTYHRFEPYLQAGVSYQQTKYFGTYLLSDQGAQATPYNYSTTEQPLLGRTGYTQMNMAAGVEYQLENNNDVFIHLFAEVGYGAGINATTSNRNFAGTTVANPMWVSVGINFGIIK
ncbi:MAG: hypothetical protein JSS79_07870 [Bacteroidetes bacterium]|nr:hypothetical protein [Bacteroidota bacterium]